MVNGLESLVGFSNISPFLGMGFLNCPICVEKLKDDVVATICGHVFHSVCVKRWIKEHRDCPSCRTPNNNRQLIKIYLDSAEDSILESSEDFSQITFEKCKLLNKQLSDRITAMEGMIEKLKIDCAEKNNDFQKVARAKASLEREFKNTKQTCFNLRTKMKYMMEDAEKAKVSTEKATRLEREILTMRGLRAILEGAQEDCDEVLKNTTDIETMAQYVAGTSGL